MRHTLKEKIAHIGRTILAWLIAYAIFALIRLFGIAETPIVETIKEIAPIAIISQLLLAALITGILYGSVDLMLDKPSIQRQAYGRILVLKTVMNLVIVIVVISFLVRAQIRWGLIDSATSDPSLRTFLTSKSFIVFLIYFGIVDISLSVYQQINQKFGRGVLLEMMMGRYHKPVEDQRIFMFIDLKSSVTIAERLGHIQYSYLLQDCFFDLNTQLRRYKAKVYQYVGDEVVLYWNLKEGLEKNNCIEFFFGFLRRLERRAEHYTNRYGIAPYFKAGAHAGRVTIAEIGLLKRDIAFHGDTVNTTSRIQGQCNAFNQRILISKDLMDMLTQSEELEFVFIGNEVLKGKNAGMELYGINHKRATIRAKTPILA